MLKMIVMMQRRQKMNGGTLTINIHFHPNGYLCKWLFSQDALHSLSLLALTVNVEMKQARVIARTTKLMINVRYWHKIQPSHLVIIKQRRQIETS